MRPVCEWADRKYLDENGPAHIVAYGDDYAQCGLKGHDPWYGTGDWHETEHAARLTTCLECKRLTGMETKPTNLTNEDPAVTAWREALS